METMVYMGLPAISVGVLKCPRPARLHDIATRWQRQRARAQPRFSSRPPPPIAKNLGREKRDGREWTGEAGGCPRRGGAVASGPPPPVAHRARGATLRYDRDDSPHHHGGGRGGGCWQLPPPAPHPLSPEMGAQQ
eukprot:6210027-Pleurochrysis_carterae.AAC.2